MKNISDKNCRENQNTYFMFNNFFSKIMPFRRKCGTAGQATDENTKYNMAHEMLMLEH